jgi:hypothetical protein
MSVISLLSCEYHSAMRGIKMENSRDSSLGTLTAAALPYSGWAQGVGCESAFTASSSICFGGSNESTLTRNQYDENIFLRFHRIRPGRPDVT